MQAHKYRPTDRDLYSFSNEHDACGVGFAVNINGRKSHRIVEQGIEILNRLLHRGAAGSDPETGDGAGILIQIPDEYYRMECSELGFELPKVGNYAVGMLFLPQDKVLCRKCRHLVEAKTKTAGMQLLGWRQPPLDHNHLGQLAEQSCPRIMQIFIGCGENFKGSAEDFERRLYLLRRIIENSAKSIDKMAADEFYIVSLSCRTVVYKGLLMAPQLAGFYTELRQSKVKSAIAMVHQRFSTNTFPTWALAQPFRYLAHNGEINTLRGNKNQMKAREQSLASDYYGSDIKKLLPIIQQDQSDSACLDNALEFFANTGRSLPHSMLMLIPQAWGDKYHLGPDVRGFFEYHAALMEPWDGPAAVAFSNGQSLGMLLDRNGLRPARYTITKDNFMYLASETGVIDVPVDEVREKGRLRPGQMLFIDLNTKRVVFDSEIKTHLARRQPYRRWVEENKIMLHGLFDSINPFEYDENKLIPRQKLFGYSREDVDKIIKVMANTGHEAIGSMGNDAALAVLSEKSQLLFNYFKQLFAQVTNPPIDPIREELVMSLTTFIGNSSNIVEESPHQANLLKLKSPIITGEDLHRISSSQISSFQSQTFHIGFCVEANAQFALEHALEKLCAEVELAILDGKSVIILSDRNLNTNHAPIPSLLAVAAVNSHLNNCGLRTSAGLIVESGEVREVMHFALLLGYGATAISPYLAFETIAHLIKTSLIDSSIDLTLAMENYIRAVCAGLLKIMSKMGISTLRSYRGAQVFEAIGLNQELIGKFFGGTASRISGIGLAEIAEEAMTRHAASQQPGLLDTGGQYHYRNNGEKHLWTPETITKLQYATRNNDYQAYREYASFINKQQNHLCTLRGLFKFKKTTPVALEEVESSDTIVKRFVTGAMSMGSLSKEAHETLAVAMNRLGGMSNSGEGGEDPVRFKPMTNGDSKCSAVKQVASGRFGVTIDYLSNCRDIQIKIAQGAKPGEGGQLPGYKVDDFIARIRNAAPGVTLISPPPHHDIYSIEDLAQLIYDLKNANPEARISVKLVSEVGIGTIAAGVAKAHADMILISGHDGGTGASPLTSIKHAGIPWELGLAETQQTLVLNSLRDRVRLQVDGQMKTGRDVVIGALLGGEEFGFGTAALVVCGCLMMRKCHSNTCPVGVATQDPELRKRFSGKPEYLINFFYMIAEEVREYMAQLGFCKFDDLIGRSEMLETDEAIGFWKSRKLDFSKIFAPTDKDLPKRRLSSQDHGIDKAYDLKLIKAAKAALEKGKAISGSFPINNVDRSAGTMLSHQVALNYPQKGLPDDTINFSFKGCAGQSFGAFLAKGISFTLEGEANDYLGKGLSGGRIIVRPPQGALFAPEKNVIAGNVLLYGATSGEVYISGQVGERFAIRNSGANAVIEGAGDHCCEYMTGGRVVVLGETGRNFGAGMSCGIAYVFDEKGNFDGRCNLDMVDLEPIDFEKDEKELKTLIEKHLHYTHSPIAARILDDWKNTLPLFVKVFPIEYRKILGQMNAEDEKIKREMINY